jgi:uncharacterized protein (TIGR03503 family)
MIYLLQKQFMIVGYIILILINSGVQAAPGDVIPTVNSIPKLIDPINPVVTKPAFIKQSIPASQVVSNPVFATQLNPARPSISAAEKQTVGSTSATQVPDDVMTFKAIDGLNIPAQSQSKIIPTSQSSDVRVIIDISGSMRENDRDNVRIPALNLIVEMLPEGSQAGVWTFGQWVNMLIPPAKVDKAWRENAKVSAKKINSHGLRTNIGEAMEKALWKFAKNSQYDQHVILLTDGLVDIAKSSDVKQQQKNEAERQRIITKVLKQYQDLGVKIHAIALSDKADKSLLEKLALETNGTSVIVNNANDLVKAFLNAFEQAAPEIAEQVPLSLDNTFEIDASVEEFTALVFKKGDSNPTQLISPSGKVISQIKGAADAKWFGESLYDLVTLTNPEPGKWKIKADLDPDNRVTVISDLKMEIVNLPSTLFPGQQVDFEVYLHENGKVLNNPDFLKLITIDMTMTAESGRSGTKKISDPENIPADGRYQESIKRLGKEGQYELKVSVDGKTFQRMRKKLIQVRQPIGFEIRKRMVDQKEVYAVRVIPQVPEIEVGKTRVIAKLKSPDATSIIQAMPWIEEGVWEAVIAADKGPGEYKIAMNVKGRLAQDQEFRIKPDPIILTFPIPIDFTHEYYVKEEGMEQVVVESTDLPAEPEISMPDLGAKMDSQAEPITEPVIDDEKPEEAVDQEISEPAVNEDAVDEDAVNSTPSWIFILIPVLTILLGVGGFFVYRIMAKKKAKANQAPPPKSDDTGMSGPDVSLNDGMDDDDFDDDFDLSDDGDDSLGGDLDDLDGLDLSNDDDDDLAGLDDLDDLGDMPDLDDDVSGLDSDVGEMKDDIPDFDENFDIDVENNEDAAEIVDTPEETAAALDELDSVLDGLTEEDEQNIPQLDADKTADAEPEEDVAEEELEGEAAVDAALANLETQLEDLGLDDEPEKS